VANKPRVAVFHRKKCSAFRKKCKSETIGTGKTCPNVDGGYLHRAASADPKAFKAHKSATADSSHGEPAPILKRLFLSPR
jgi:hypothetical protein